MSVVEGIPEKIIFWPSINGSLPKFSPGGYIKGYSSTTSDFWFYDTKNFERDGEKVSMVVKHDLSVIEQEGGYIQISFEAMKMLLEELGFKEV